MSRNTHELLIRDQERLRAFASALLRDPHAAEDVVQDTWIVAATRDGQARDPEGWLRSITRNLALRKMRSAGRRRSREARAARGEHERSTSERVEAIELRRNLLDAVELLDEPYRSTIVSRYLDDQMPSAIAKADGIPVKTVKTRLARGLEKLRQHLDRSHGDRRAWALPLGAVAASSGGVVTTSTAVSILVGRVIATKVWIAACVVAVISFGVWLAVEYGGDEPTKIQANEPEVAEGDAEHPGLRAGGAAPSAPGLQSPERASPRSAAAPSDAPSPHDPTALRSAPSAAGRMNLSGRIVDPDGGGIAGVRVTVSQRASTEPSVSDQSGAFRIEKAVTVDGIVELRFDDVPPAFLEPAPIRLVAGPEVIIVTLERGLTVTGRVLAPTGVKYTSLSIHSQAASARGRTFSRRGTLKADGRFVIGGLRPKARVRIICKDKWLSRPGQFAPTIIEDVPAGARHIEVVMQTGHVLEGSAIEADGTPYGSKFVMLVSEKSPHLGGDGRRSDSEGNFRFTGLAPGVYYAGLSSAKGIDLLNARTRVEVPSPRIELRAGPLPQLTLRVRPRADQEDLDLSAFLARAVARGGAWHLDGYTIKSSEDGVFAIPVIKGASYDVFIHGAGSPWYAHAKNLSTDGEAVEIRLMKGRRIEGRVLDVHGKPLKGGGRVDLVVGSFGRSTEIRPDGTFILLGVPPGRHTVRARPQHSSLATWEYGVEAGRKDLVIRLR